MHVHVYSCKSCVGDLHLVAAAVLNALGHSQIDVDTSDLKASYSFHCTKHTL